MSRRGEHPNSRANLQPFMPGNQAARKHGGYARHFDPALVDEVEQSDSKSNVERIESLIKLERLRLHSVLAERAKYESRDDYAQTRGADLPITHHETHPGGAVTKRQRPDFEQAIDRSTGRLLALIVEQERLAASPAHIAQALAGVLDDAAQAGMSATDTAEAVERAGLAVPFSLQQRVRAELALAEPEPPEGGMTDEELDQLSREYDNEAAAEQRWLEQRRDDMAAIHAAKAQEKHSE